MTITEFLEALIAEDEALANASIANYTPDEWDNPSRWANHYAADVEFWDAHTPYRVLAECAAKRAIIEYHSMLLEQSEHSDVAGYHATGMRIAIRKLAAVYASHPGYQEDWAA